VIGLIITSVMCTCAPFFILGHVVWTRVASVFVMIEVTVNNLWWAYECKHSVTLCAYCCFSQASTLFFNFLLCILLFQPSFHSFFIVLLWFGQWSISVAWSVFLSDPGCDLVKFLLLGYEWNDCLVGSALFFLLHYECYEWNDCVVCITLLLLIASCSFLV